MLSYPKVFDWLMWCIIFKLGVRCNSFNLSPKVEIIVALDVDEFGVLKHCSLKPDLEILPIWPESSKWTVLWRRIMITRPNSRHKDEIVHLGELFELFPVLPGWEIVCAIGSIVRVEAIKVWLSNDGFTFLVSEIFYRFHKINIDKSIQRKTHSKCARTSAS